MNQIPHALIHTPLKIATLGICGWLLRGAKRYNIQAISRCWRQTCFTALLLIPSHAHALAAEGLSEAQIKAAYLYNFAKFVEWPAEVLAADAEIVLCVVGNNVLDNALQSLDGRKAGAHLLRVVQSQHAEDNLHACQMLFIGVSEQSRFVTSIKALQNAPVLTLSDSGDFAEKGGGIALLFRDNKVGFEVNLESIHNAGLRLPGQLLNIATHVYGR